jgi:hypothetical protein
MSRLHTPVSHCSVSASYGYNLLPRLHSGIAPMIQFGHFSQYFRRESNGVQYPAPHAPIRLHIAFPSAQDRPKDSFTPSTPRPALSGSHTNVGSACVQVGTTD